MTEPAGMLLFMFPGACSRVTMSALEEAGLSYEQRMVNLRSLQQKSPEFLATNPKGKVPALRIGDAIMTENAAILSFLDRQHPAARLLPHSDDPLTDTQGLVDLIWCTGTLHPIVRQMRAPQRMTTGDPAGVVADGMDKFTYECGRLADRLSGGRWWYGADWSIVDVYLYWLYSTAEKGGFPLHQYAVCQEHAERVRARPSFQKALKREEAAVEQHRADLPPDFRF